MKIGCSTSFTDDIARKAYCILGLPIDALDMRSILDRIETATHQTIPFLISTPNLNFLVNSWSDPEFRESVLDSDLCTADGIAVIWFARLIGAPIKERVSGSDILDALKTRAPSGPRLKIFLFGGAQGVAEKAAANLNAAQAGLTCVGTLNPGFGSLEEISADEIIDKVNASNAQFLVAALGATKGQLWLHRNHQRLRIQIRAHFGAAINFQAGTVMRAPLWIRMAGFEWLWRIKEEPHLWVRYVYDGLSLLRVMFTRVLPLAIIQLLYGLTVQRRQRFFSVDITEMSESVTIRLTGDLVEAYVAKAIVDFRKALPEPGKTVIIDLSRCHFIDSRFFGLLLMVRKELKSRGVILRFIGISPRLKRLFRLNELGFLLSTA